MLELAWGAIGRASADGFVGVFNFSESRPSVLGATLYRMARDLFDSDLDRMCEQLIDAHPAGWIKTGRWCYCHANGDDSAECSFLSSAITDQKAPGVKYAYAIDPDARTMTIYVSSLNHIRTEAGPAWDVTGFVSFDEPSPDWQGLDQRALEAFVAPDDG